MSWICLKRPFLFWLKKLHPEHNQEYLQIPDAKRVDFVRRARGMFVTQFESPAEMSLAEAPAATNEKQMPKHNLLRQATPFFGRKTELTQITANLADPNCHLLTILGAGGMGKRA